MYAYRVPAAALVLAAAAGLSGCTSYGYGPYGYGGASIGYSSGYYDPYYSRYPYRYSSSRYGYGYPYYGWYNSFYYPGTGIYVYDRYRRPHRWTDSQRRYWTVQRERAVRASPTRERVIVRENWSGFRRPAVRPSRARNANRAVRVERAQRRDDRRD
jgi:hypothetical protein